MEVWENEKINYQRRKGKAVKNDGFLEDLAFFSPTAKQQKQQQLQKWQHQQEQQQQQQQKQQYNVKRIKIT